MAIRELPGIWEAKWKYRPLLAETFCDIERTAGTCYRAAGWEEVGKTKGFSRHARDFFIPNDRPKVLFMKPFVRNAWDLIVSNDLPRAYEKAAHSKADGLLPFKPKQIDSLYEKLRQVVDPRARNRKIHIGFLLTAYTMAIDGKFVKEVCGVVSLVDVDTGRVVSVAPCSRKEGLTGECEYPVANAMMLVRTVGLWEASRHPDMTTGTALMKVPSSWSGVRLGPDWMTKAIRGGP